MYQELFILGGYGAFVWPSFVFTLASCFIFYLKTKKELEEQEKVFLSEFEYSNVKISKKFKEKKVTKEVLSVSSI